MDLSSVVETLTRQLPAKEISIAGACLRIENHIGALTRDDSRSLRHALPALLKLAFGSPDYAGLIELLSSDSFSARADCDALKKLLAPRGVLFSALLGQVPDASIFYEIASSALPFVTRKALELRQLDLLPADVYEGRMGQLGDGFVLRLNMVEYFLFYFLYLFSPQSGVAYNRKKSDPQLARRASTDLCTDVYLQLLQEYLNFMVPKLKLSDLNPAQVNPPDDILTSLLLRPASPVWSRADMGLRYSEFFTGALVEFWMNTYLYAIDPSTEVPVSEPSFQLPSAELMKALQLAARHHSTIFATVLILPASIHDPAYKSLAEKAFDSIRLSFYRYIRLALAVWPVDGSLSSLVDIWLTLISPWLDLDASVGSLIPLNPEEQGFAVTWRPYVVETFYLYQSLYAEFFFVVEGALSGFVRSGECEDVEEMVNRLNVLASNLVECTMPLLSVCDILKRLESDLARSVTMRATSIELVAIREQIKVLEPESFQPTSLFEDGKTRSVVSRLLVHLDKLSSTVFDHYHKALMPRQAPAVNEDDCDESRHSEVDGASLALEFILNSRQVPAAVQNLAKWFLQTKDDLVNIFNLQEKDLMAVQSGSLDAASCESANAAQRLLNPPSRKRLLERKFAARSSTARISTPDLIPRSNEIAVLVPLLNSISLLATEAFRTYILAGIETRWKVQVPRSIWSAKISLRFFAAYPNLIFTLLSLLIIRMLVKAVF